ncbi:hypothetical protein [Methylobacterium sp. J-076]|uniref:hypothetical protein n=1 Tax=Methylobacterium sp. J-076 TaxID=2836655 RepID=UPI001FBA4E15|nr:hypothetical protein [Methylobacterium sp. J-076]MCJ2014981.1 hypothetical protein [Methylobacterium sp. J-076]
MIAPLPSIPSGPKTVVVSLHRDAVADIAHQASLYARHAVEYAALRDDRGLMRSLRLLTICAAHAAEALPGFAEAVAESEEEARR